MADTTYFDFSPPAISAAWLNEINAQTYRGMQFPTASSQHFTQNGAVIQRMNDRTFIGGAVANDGAFPNVAKDWLTTFQISTGLSSGSVVSSVAASLNSTNSASAVGFTAGVQTQYFTSSTTNGIGLTSIVVNNNATLGTAAWAFYAEAHKTSASSASTYCMEVDTRSTVATINPTPWQQGDVIGHQIGSGAGVSAVGQFDASAAIQIVRNPMKWKVGINFLNDSLTSAGIAVALAGGASTHSVTWFESGGSIVGSIKSSSTSGANATTINFASVGLQIAGNAAQSLAYFINVPSAVNYLQFTAGTTTNSPTISAVGSDTNIDLYLQPQGTGLVRYGSYTAGVVAQAGYITIRDSGGTLRRLLVG